MVMDLPIVIIIYIPDGGEQLLTENFIYFYCLRRCDARKKKKGNKKHFVKVSGSGSGSGYLCTINSTCT
jgi:hypothetical protein